MNILITGCNRGLGLETCKNIIKKYKNSNLLFTSRNKKASELLIDKHFDIKDNIINLKLDINDSSDVQDIIAYMKKYNIKLDLLVNNAGILIDKDDPESAIININTNFNSTVSLTNKLYENDLFEYDSNIINISSFLGNFNNFSNAEFKNKLKNFNFTANNYDELIEDYISNMLNYHRKISIKKSYLFSKLLLTLWSYQNSKMYNNNNIYMFPLCPGWIKTDMGGSMASGEVIDGYNKISNLLDLDIEIKNINNGLLYANNKFVNINN